MSLNVFPDPSSSGGFTADANNSTTSTLTAGSTFTGTATNIAGYDRVRVSMKQSPNVIPDGDANTAQGSLHVEFSPDGTNWDTSIPVVVRTGIFIPQSYVTFGMASFRVRYLNDGGASAITALGLTETADSARNQTAFRLQSALFKSGVGELGRTLDQSVSGSDPVMLVRSVIAGKVAGTDDTHKNTTVNESGALHVADYGLEVSRGNLGDKMATRVEGRNASVGTTEQVISNVGGAYNFLTAAATIRIKAGGNANDTAAGTGAREITVVGLDSTGAIISEAIATNGASVSSATSASFRRINDAYVSAAGTYATGAIATGSNTGAISIETSGGTLMAIIPANTGREAVCAYTVPVNKKGYFKRIRVTPEGAKAVTFRLWTREGFDTTSAPFGAKLLRAEWVALAETSGFELQHPFQIPGKTDIWVSAKVASSTSAASAAFELEIVDD